MDTKWIVVENKKKRMQKIHDKDMYRTETDHKSNYRTSYKTNYRPNYRANYKANYKTNYKTNRYNKYQYFYETDDENMKKILCNNMLIRGKCNYGNKCLYAHNIYEQNVDPIRKKAYDIIMNNKMIDDEPDNEL